MLITQYRFIVVKRHLVVDPIRCYCVVVITFTRSVFYISSWFDLCISAKKKIVIIIKTILVTIVWTRQTFSWIIILNVMYLSDVFRNKTLRSRRTPLVGGIVFTTRLRAMSIRVVRSAFIFFSVADPKWLFTTNASRFSINFHSINLIAALLFLRTCPAYVEILIAYKAINGFYNSNRLFLYSSRGRKRKKEEKFE